MTIWQMHILHFYFNIKFGLQDSTNLIRAIDQMSWQVNDRSRFYNIGQDSQQKISILNFK